MPRLRGARWLVSGVHRHRAAHARRDGRRPGGQAVRNGPCPVPQLCRGGGLQPLRATGAGGRAVRLPLPQRGHPRSLRGGTRGAVGGTGGRQATGVLHPGPGRGRAGGGVGKAALCGPAAARRTDLTSGCGLPRARPGGDIPAQGPREVDRLPRECALSADTRPRHGNPPLACAILYGRVDMVGALTGERDKANGARSDGPPRAGDRRSRTQPVPVIAGTGGRRAPHPGHHDTAQTDNHNNKQPQGHHPQGPLREPMRRCHPDAPSRGVFFSGREACGVRLDPLPSLTTPA